MKLRRGFTLIELLVVVAIIGVLATIVLASLSLARERARDARRHADIRTIQSALELYYSQHGQYPSTVGIGGIAPNSNWANSGNISWENLENIMETTLPRDPVNYAPVSSSDWAATGNRRLNYVYASTPSLSGANGCPVDQSYTLVYRLEKGDVSGDERIGMTRCDNGQKFYRSYGAITTGMTPAG